MAGGRRDQQRPGVPRRGARREGLGRGPAKLLEVKEELRRSVRLIRIASRCMLTHWRCMRQTNGEQQRLPINTDTRYGFPSQ